jgi:hypothetical protein
MVPRLNARATAALGFLVRRGFAYSAQLHGAPQIVVEAFLGPYPPRFDARVDVCGVCGDDAGR